MSGFTYTCLHRCCEVSVRHRLSRNGFDRVTVNGEEGTYRSFSQKFDRGESGINFRIRNHLCLQRDDLRDTAEKQQARTAQSTDLVNRFLRLPRPAVLAE